MWCSTLSTIGILVMAAGGLTLVLGSETKSPLRRKANYVAYLVMCSGGALFIKASLI